MRKAHTAIGAAIAIPVPRLGWARFEDGQWVDYEPAEPDEPGAVEIDGQWWTRRQS